MVAAFQDEAKGETLMERTRERGIFEKVENLRYLLDSFHRWPR